MASTHKVKLLVKDCDDMDILDQEIDGSVTGVQLFREMNSRCEFGKWSRADALGENVRFNVMNSRDPRHNEERVTGILQDIIDRLGRAGVPCEFTFKVQKKEEFRDPAADSPEGPEYALNPVCWVFKTRRGPTWPVHRR